MLHRYWIRFSSNSPPSVLNIGCGVTAFDRDDALSIVKYSVFPEYGIQEIIDIIEDVDISELDQGHVIPNMRSPSVRGVWFPIL